MVEYISLFYKRFLKPIRLPLSSLLDVMKSFLPDRPHLYDCTSLGVIENSAKSATRELGAELRYGYMEPCWY